MRSLNNTIAFATILLSSSVGACAHRASVNDITEAQRAYLNPVTPVHRSLAGCYELSFGPWLDPNGRVLDSARWDAPDFSPPAVVKLVAEESSVPIGGHLRVIPQPRPTSAFIYATWSGNADTLSLEWSIEGGFGTPMLFLSLHRALTGYAGRLYTASDFRAPRPYRHAIARRTTCARLAQ